METTSNLNGSLKDSYGGRKVSDRGFFGGMMDYIDDIRSTVVRGGKARRKKIEDADRMAEDPSYDPDASPAKDHDMMDRDSEKPTKTTSRGFKARMKA